MNVIELMTKASWDVEPNPMATWEQLKRNHPEACKLPLQRMSAALAAIPITEEMIGALLEVDLSKGDYRHLIEKWTPRIKAMLAVLVKEK